MLEVNTVEVFRHSDGIRLTTGDVEHAILEELNLERGTLTTTARTWYVPFTLRIPHRYIAFHSGNHEQSSKRVEVLLDLNVAVLHPGADDEGEPDIAGHYS